jgi:hypothetical protein
MLFSLRSSRGTTETDREYNANFAFKYAGRVHDLIQRRTGGNAVLYAETIAECYLKNVPLPQHTFTAAQLERLLNKYHLCLKIVVNSVGVEDRYSTIEHYKDELSQLCHFVSDIDCGVLAEILAEEYANRSLAHQR